MGDCRYISFASGYLKLSMVILVLALVLHIVGISTPNWFTVRLVSSKNKSHLHWIEGSDHEGLWQICSCYDIFESICSCMGRHGDPVWFKMAQMLEIIALIGLIISGVMSMIQMCSRQDKKLKRVNVFIVIGTGVCGVLGVTVYGIRTQNKVDDIIADFDRFGVKVHGYLDLSFYFCSIASLLYLLVCTPLLIKDERMPAPPVIQEPEVVYNSQGQLTISSEMQGTTIMANIGQVNAGYLPSFDHAPYIPPPAYSLDGHQQQTDWQHSQFNGGIPFKSIEN